MAYKLYSNREICRLQRLAVQKYGDCAYVSELTSMADAQMRNAGSERAIVAIADKFIGML